jgi:uncharacterized protein (TIGR02217 family)
MSTQVLPALAGLGFDVVRQPRWSNSTQRSVSGKTTRIAYWNYPLWTWTLKFDFLRADPTNVEWQQLVSFFNSMRGGFDSFLFDDVDDDGVTGQTIGTGAGATTTFQLVRSMSGFVEPIYAPDTTGAIGSIAENVYVNGVPKTINVDYTVSAWGTAAPGVVTFTSAPTGTITADFNYYWPCRFATDSMDFTKFMKQLWRGDKVAFESIR